MKKLLLLLGLVVFVVIIANQGGGKDKDGRESASSTDSAPTTTTSFDTHDVMSHNGTWELGGMDGRDWGVYSSTVPAGSTCTWSIRSVARYRPGIVLDEGTAGPGESVRVSIEPDGDVSAISGQIDDDHRLVFMTSGCGRWSMT
ncbi:hypothetical protein [Mycobacterium antarcticum]|uniref:hypothetical protein n=1 Tax=Mycolicibacterium sp. TUM20984 TaxID=3023368 RepID=UPI002394024F|nr:hypothetical protein [Mycolicibacterium sp. TUM20984]GLP83640.1 hypothetical protein TUM20984_50600 [Mycolicibacterium sp. TUM20984]